MKWSITEDPPQHSPGTRDFVVHDRLSRSRLLIGVHAIPCGPLYNGQIADLLIVLAACLGHACPPGVALTDHVIHDDVRSAQLAFEHHCGFANVTLLYQDDAALDGEAPTWQVCSPASIIVLIPCLTLLAAHLTVHRHLRGLHDEPNIGELRWGVKA